MKSYFVGLVLLAVFGIINIGIATATSVTVPNGVTSYVPVTITPTSQINGNFQQMVYFNPQTYSTYLSSNMQNVEFFYPDGALIPSWLESYTTSNAVYWLNLNGVTSGETIYMGFASTATSLFSTSNNVGEAPYLSSTYGEYDTGSNVFSYYQSFGGLTSLPSGWSNTTTEDSVYGKTLVTLNSANTVITSQGKGCGCGIYETPQTSMSPGNVIEWYGDMYNTQPAGSIAGLLATGSIPSSTSTYQPYGFDYPQGIVISGSTAYVVNNRGGQFSTGNVVEININNGQVVGAIDSPYFNRPYDIALSGSDLYVTNNFGGISNNGNVIEFNTNGQFINSIDSSAFSDPFGIAVYGSTIYVLNALGQYGAKASGNVIEISTANGQITGSINSPYFNDPYGISISSSGTLYIVNRQGGPSGTGNVIEFTNTGQFIGAIDSPAFDYPQSLNLSGTTLYVTNDNSKNVIEINTTTDQVTNSISSGDFVNPFGVASDGTSVYVTNPAGINHNSGTGDLLTFTPGYACTGLPMPLYEFNCHSMLYAFQTGDSAMNIITTGPVLTPVNPSYVSNANQVYSISIAPTGTSFSGLINYQLAATSSATPQALTTFTFSPGYNPATGVDSSPQSVYWLRTRVLPPNGQMPAVSFGSPTNVPLSVSLSLSPNLAYAGQNVDFTPTVTGGAGPYTYNYIVYNAVSGQLIYNSIGISSVPFSYAPTATGNYLGQIEVTDSNTPNDIAYSAKVPFNAIPYNGVVITSNVLTVDLGQQVLLTVNDIGTSVGTLVSPLVGQGNDQFSIYLVNSIVGTHTPINGGATVTETQLPMSFPYTPNVIGYVNYTVGGEMVTPLSYPTVSNSVTVKVNSDPTISASESATSVLTGGTETLTATVTGGTSQYSYQWYTISGSANTPVSGATSSTYVPSTSSTGTFTYGVNVIDAVGMSAYSNVVSYSVSAPVTTTITTGGGPIFTGGLPPTTTVRPTTTIAPVATTSVPASPTPPPTTTVKAAPPTTTVLPTTPTTTGNTLPPPSGIKPPSSSNTTLWLILAIIIIILILLALYWYSRRNKKGGK